MKVRFTDLRTNNGRTIHVAEIDGAKITYRNFEGREGTYNDFGNRNFGLIIPDEEIAELFLNDTNQYGVGWNVKIKAPRDEGDRPFMHIPVKVAYNSKGPDPSVYLVSGTRRHKLGVDAIKRLDRIDIDHVDLDISASDGKTAKGPYRKAYLRAIEVYQNMDRFTERWAEEEHPEDDMEELPFH